jgi:hypothetical protein
LGQSKFMTSVGPTTLTLISAPGQLMPLRCSRLARTIRRMLPSEGIRR